MTFSIHVQDKNGQVCKPWPFFIVFVQIVLIFFTFAPLKQAAVSKVAFMSVKTIITMKKIAISLSLAAFMFSGISCDGKKSQESGKMTDSLTNTANNENNENWSGGAPTFQDLIKKLPLQESIDVALDSMDRAWAALYSNDSLKFANVNRLLDEAQIVKTYKADLAENVRKELKKTQEARFKKDNYGSADVLDNYDRQMAKLFESIGAMQNGTPNFNSLTFGLELIAEIREADGKDFFLRRDYVDYVKLFNSILTENKDAVKALGGKYASMSELPVFTYKEGV
jgi:hypothetical protein